MKVVRIVLLFFLFLLVSCSKKPDYVLSQNKMVNVLTDLHFADAAGTTLYSQNLDSARIYSWVFKKNKITAAEFDSSLVYYSKHGDKLVQIYNKVLVNLSKKEAEIEDLQAKKGEKKKEVIWEDKKVYRLPFDGATNRIPFDVPVSKPGIYTVSVKVKVFNKDQSVNPHLTAYFWYKDDTTEGKKEYFKAIPYQKNNKTTTYSTTLTLNNRKISHLRGFVLDHDNSENNFIKQAEIYNISVTFEKK